MKISSRKALAAELVAIGIEKSKLDSLYTVLDKRNKVPKDAFEEMIRGVVADEQKRDKVLALMSVDSMEQLIAIASEGDVVTEALDELKKLFGYLELMGIADFCKFDISIVRGLAYYTGVVFEIFDADSELRAIGGGGRYDNLLADFGGQGLGPQVGLPVHQLARRQPKLFHMLKNAIFAFVFETVDHTNFHGFPPADSR